MVFIEYDSMVYLDNYDHQKEVKTELGGFDLVFSKVGTIGEVAILDSQYKRWNFSQNTIGLKVSRDKISPAYLLFYLLSKYGQMQIKRAEMGQVQPKLELEDIRKLRVISVKNEKNFDSYLQEINVFRDEANQCYLKAESLLLKELGLEDFEADNSLYSVVNLSEIRIANRMDADYFQAKYKKLIGKLKNSKKLDEIASMKKGFEPGSDVYQEEGKSFIRVSNMSKDGIKDNDQKCLSEELYEKLKKDYQPGVGEILLTKDATPGIACVVKEDIEGVISSGILRLSLKEKIEPEYLASCINSIVGKLQAERDAGGSIINHWWPDQIKELVIPILPMKIQQKIAELVKKSHESRKKSKALLEEAKRKVEEMIERDS